MKRVMTETIYVLNISFIIKNMAQQIYMVNICFMCKNVVRSIKLVSTPDMLHQKKMEAIAYKNVVSNTHPPRLLKMSSKSNTGQHYSDSQQECGYAAIYRYNL